MLLRKLLFVIFIAHSGILLAGGHHLNWKIMSSPGFADRLSFDQALYNGKSQAIWQSKSYSGIIAHAYLTNEVIESVNSSESLLLNEEDFENEFEVQTFVSNNNGKVETIIEVLPVRVNSITGRIEKLISFDLEIIYGRDHSSLRKASANDKRTWESNSKLAQGNWYKLGILNSGAYLLNYNYLTSIDGSFAGASINNIRLFGNGGNMLPEINNIYDRDDLKEIPMQIGDQNGNGQMDPGDFLLFYGDATDEWTLKDGRFKRTVNVYADTSYYFLSKDYTSGNALRINSRASESGSSISTFSTFDARYQHQLDINNINKSGREWYGELFDFELYQTFAFSIPNLIKSDNLCIDFQGIARSTPTTSRTKMRVDINGLQLGNIMDISGSTDTYGPQAKSANLSECIIPQSSGVNNDFTIGVNFDKNGFQSAKGYLNYITINARRQLIWDGGSMHFRRIDSENSGIYTYNLSQMPNDLFVWDISDVNSPIQQQINGSNGNYNFKYQSDGEKVNEFIAFNIGSVGNPVSVRAVGNQNLHAHQPKELIIITHPAFYSEANRFAEYKRSQKGLSVHLVTTYQIFNEFSSGKQDLSAMRDYIKMMYDRDSTVMKNILLFGDGSYDYKFRTPENQNFVPVFQSKSSLDNLKSHSSDDYIAFLSDGIGDWPNDSGGNVTHKMKVGVGRFPVKTLEEARVVVDKVIYYENKQNVLGDWLNKMTFVADDGDFNTHMRDADGISNAAKRANPGMDIQKIYLDAYPELASPSGALSVEGQNALDRAIQEGTLILNYSGHGGEVGWTEEKLLRLDQIYRWGNYEKLTFFFTATCEFGRYDDPDVVSGGELVLLVENGGAVSIMTTTRPVFASSNERLNLAFYNYIFSRDENGDQLTLGEVIRRTKNQSNDANNRSFALLGDPSMKLNYPEKKVLITEINGVDPAVSEDTLKALCLINVKGEVTDLDSTLFSNYNGFVDLKVYDKELQLQTLGNSGAKFNYSQYKNLLFKGKASVKDGRFSVDFVVPKDIDYSLGKGRITAYAYGNNGINAGTDANGYETRFSVGLSCDNIIPDNDAPEISVYLDDTTFTSGSLTSSSPELIAFLEDENGINFTGTGIGHDITSETSALPGEKIILNDYYLSELDNYQKGSISYQLKDLSDGEHTLKLKAWDTHNNSSEVEISFVIASDEGIAIRNLINYPNPFTDRTNFSFDHNLAGEDLELYVEISDKGGRIVKKTNIQIPFSNTRVDGKDYNELSWDGTNSSGKKIPSGVYFFKLTVKSIADGSVNQEIRRLVYIK